MITFSATVNGVHRSVLVPLAVLDGVIITEQTDGEELLNHIEMIVENDYGLYSAFYEDATDADYDAPLEDRTATVGEW